MTLNKTEYRNIQTKRVYDGRFFNVVDEEVELEGGLRCWRQTVEHSGAVVILPQISETEFLITKQYRHSVRETILELPAGSLEPGEDPLACAKREISEEVGHRAHEWIVLA